LYGFSKSYNIIEKLYRAINYDKKMDVYSIGIILNELINLKPFPEFTCGPLRVNYDRLELIQFSKHNHNQYILRQECSQELKDLTNKMLNSNEIDRPTIDEIISIRFINNNCLKYIEKHRANRLDNNNFIKYHQLIKNLNIQVNILI
jgi:serine/threonine protein kinase